MRMEHLNVRRYKQRKIKLLAKMLERHAREHWGSTKFKSFKKRFLKFDVHAERGSGWVYVGIWEDDDVHVYVVDARGGLWNEYSHIAFDPKKKIDNRVKAYFGYLGDDEKFLTW